MSLSLRFTEMVYLVEVVLGEAEGGGTQMPPLSPLPVLAFAEESWRRVATKEIWKLTRVDESF